jgi:O-antigen ligase
MSSEMQSTLNEERNLRASQFEARRGSLFESLLASGLLLLIMFSVLAFGAVEEWSLLVLESGAALLFLALAGKQLYESTLSLAPNPLYLAMGLFGIVCLVQIVFGLSAYAHATLIEAWKYCAYGVFFLVSNQLFRRVRQLERFIAVLALFGFAVALFAIAQNFAGNGKLFWLRSTQWTTFFGPYVNRSHYAGLMEMLTPVPLLMCLRRTRTSVQRALLFFMGLLMGTTVFLSGSRGGMAAFIVEIVFLAICIVRVGRNRRTAWTLTVFCLLVFLMLAALDKGTTLNRIETLQHPFSERVSGNRLTIVRDSLRMFSDHPIIGWGLGTFPIVYPHYRSFYTNFFINEAHNDYVQTLVETGLLGFTAAMGFVVLLYRTSFKKLLREHLSLDGGGRMAALAGCTGILVHSLFDFNLHIPANAALFYVLCAIATVDASQRKHGMFTS